MTSLTMTAAQPAAPHKLESAALATLLAFVAALQLSIAIAHILLTVTLLLWGAWSSSAASDWKLRQCSGLSSHTQA